MVMCMINYNGLGPDKLGTSNTGSEPRYPINMQEVYAVLNKQHIHKAVGYHHSLSKYHNWCTGV